MLLVSAIATCRCSVSVWSLKESSDNVAMADRQTARITPSGTRPSSAWTGRERGRAIWWLATLSVFRSLHLPLGLVGQLVCSPHSSGRERESRHFPTHPGLTAAATSSVSQGRESIEEEKVLSLSVVQCCQKVVSVKHFHFEMPNSI